MTDAVHADLAFLHGFQQRALSTWCRPIDLIGQHQLGEDRPRMEGEATTGAVIDGGAGDVGGQHVAGELDALELQPQAACQRMGQGGLAYTGHVFQQQMSLGQQAGHCLAYLVFLAEDDTRDLIDGLMDEGQRPLINQRRKRKIE